MNQLDLLQQELNMIQENIDRVKEYKKQESENKWTPNHCLVFGELKHRLVALKQRIVIINKSSTCDLFKGKI